MRPSDGPAGPPPVVVTGLGVVTAAGWGLEAFATALREGRTALESFCRFDHTGHRTHIAGEVPAAPPSARAIPGWSRLSHSDRFAVFAAREALAQAGLPAPLEATRAGVYFASSTGGLFETEQYFLADTGASPARPLRRLLDAHSLSSPAESVARDRRVGGPVETIASSCAAGTLAVRQALDAIRTGEVDIAIAGGADGLCLTTFSGFDALRAMDAQPCRPFRADRGGLSLGEGAGVLILETLDHAVARGATPLALVVGAGASCDADHMTAPTPDGLWAVEAVRRALDDAGVSSDDIDVVNAHGTATPLNDAAEAAALARVFGARFDTLAIEATKGLFGHLLGAAGAVEAVATVFSLADGLVHATPRGAAVETSIAPGLVLGASRTDLGPRLGLSVNLGFGGANAALVFQRWEAA
ncbi:MAG: beta-ketoacyl-[acyl-carrier-protein] synthase family protein [Vicinamibacterales bacterium]